jgi:hypothetical protein
MHMQNPRDNFDGGRHKWSQVNQLVEEINRLLWLSR